MRRILAAARAGRAVDSDVGHGAPPTVGAVLRLLGSETTDSSTFVHVTEHIVRAIEAVGIVVLVVGLLVVFVGWLVRPGRWSPDGYRFVRRGLGGVILLGLEILVVADLVRTVIVEPTLSSVAALGLLVLVRTLLSWSITVEVEGAWPWKLRAINREEREAARDSG
jgi:uncharacterized membrane protein